MCVFFGFTGTAFAQTSLVITEIMYDLPGTDSEHEWVEIHNPGSSAVTLVGGIGGGSWRFNDGSNHTLAETPASGSMTLNAGAYAIISANAATFLADHPTFNGTVIDTVMSLANSGDTLKIIDGEGNISDTVTYTSSQGAVGDGNSLQLSGSSWVSGTPTPGANAVGSSGTTTTSQNTSNTNTQADTTAAAEVKKKVIADEPAHIQSEISVPLVGITGMPIRITTTVHGTHAEERRWGEFRYAFGDGTGKTKKVSDPFDHIYEYPGTYVLTFEYRSYAYLEKPEATSRHVIEIREAGVHVKTNADGTLDIVNDSDYEADISGWTLQQDATSFSFSVGTAILPGKSIRVNPKQFGFSTNGNFTLVLSSGVPIQQTEPVLAAISTKEKQVTNEPVAIYVPKEAPPTVLADIEKNAPLLLEANALGAVSESKKESRSSVIPFLVGLVGIIGGSIYALKYAKLKKAETPTPNESKEIADTIRIIDDE